MTLDRRHFLAAAGAYAAAPRLAFAADANPAWRTFEVTTRVQLKGADAASMLWLPLPSVRSDWQEPLGEMYSSNGTARIATDPRNGARMLHVQFASTGTVPYAEVTSRLRTRDRRDALGQPVAGREEARTLREWLAPTDMIPTDGIVRSTALKAAGGARTDVEKARAIYDWVVANGYREPKVRGCGEGNVRAMLESGDLSGKCVDLNSLFVGLCRAVGVPARDMFGLRLAPSQLGYREIGANSARLDAAQHCRAEVYLQAHGWVPADPADVAKVMRQETPEWIRSVSHPKVQPIYGKLFGNWEANWLAWNDAHDLRLPGARSGKLPFLMYPIAEIGGDRIDSYAPENFSYTISAREVS